MADYRSDLPERPYRIAKLPLDDRGYPVPAFVTWFDQDGEVTQPGDGKPDFRVVSLERVQRCIAGERCWICDGVLGGFRTFVIGPMCCVNRISSEPPSHLDCAEYAVRACPFLILPNSKRREADLPPEATEPAGTMLRRNPGCSALWTTKRYQIETAREGGEGYLFRLAAPTSLTFWAEGRRATRAEVDASIESGLPVLRETCVNARELGKLTEAVTAATELLDKQGGF